MDFSNISYIVTYIVTYTQSLKWKSRKHAAYVSKDWQIQL